MWKKQLKNASMDQSMAAAWGNMNVAAASGHQQTPEEDHLHPSMCKCQSLELQAEHTASPWNHEPAQMWFGSEATSEARGFCLTAAGKIFLPH